MPSSGRIMRSHVPALRIRPLNQADVNRAGDFVLYWMTAYHRVRWNFSLQRAAEWARELGKPIVVLEELRCGGRWDSDRLHAFALEGMTENAAALAEKGVAFYPFVETRPGEGKALLAAIAARACVVVTDDFPILDYPSTADESARSLGVLLEAVDSNGILPLGATDQVFPTAYAFRRFLQANLRDHLMDLPEADPLAEGGFPTGGRVPEELVRMWPPADPALLAGSPRALAALPIDHSVKKVAIRGGSLAAESALRRFLEERIDTYAEQRNEPEQEATSGLSPYLRFGHISAHQIFSELTEREGWHPGRLAGTASGSRSGWWGIGRGAEAFLDQLITWRELGFNMTSKREDYDRFESLPDWVRKTLSEHAADPRPYEYSPEELESASTHDPLWNAAQMQLAREGRLHNYLRMLWGKKILEWSPSPREALEVMIHLNNKYALDGRDPNSYSGIFWILGRYDRPWGPERPIFGLIRYMSSENTARKVRVVDYVKRYAP